MLWPGSGLGLGSYRFISEHAEQYNVARPCRVLDVHRSGYARWVGAAGRRVARAAADAAPTAEIREAQPGLSQDRAGRPLAADQLEKHRVLGQVMSVGGVRGERREGGEVGVEAAAAG